MSFVVENGSGTVALANSYNTVAQFRAYWDDRDLEGFDHTQFSTAKIQRALIRATDYLESRYRNRFKGMRLVYDPPQPLSFPRSNLYVRCVLIEGVPNEIKNAVNEYAKRVLTTAPELRPDPGGFDSTGQLIGNVREKVGPLEVETQYEAGSAASARDYPAADELVADFICSSGGVIRG